MGWVVVNEELFASPRVVQVAFDCNLTELHVIGALCCLWNYAHHHGERDGKGGDIRVEGNRNLVDALARHKGFYDALKAYRWILEHEEMPGYLVFRNLRKHFPDGKTHGERMAELDDRRRRKAEKQSDWRGKSDTSRVVTPEMVYAKKQEGRSDGQLRAWGWLHPGETSQQFYDRHGWTPTDGGAR